MVEAITGDEARILWVGSEDILNRVDFSSGEVTHYPLPIEGGTVPRISSLWRDVQGIVWVGVANALYRILSVLEDQERGVRLGIDRYFTKPFNAAGLLTNIDQLLAQRRANKKA